MLAMAATLFASCEKSDDDMPRLDTGASVSPVLASVTDAIDGSQETYTFSFAPGTFVVDGQEVTLGAKDKATQYALQVDLENGDFSAPATVEKQNYDGTDQFTIGYDALCSAVCVWNPELATPVKSWEGNLKYRILMLPGNNADDGLASDPIVIRTKIKYVDPNPKFYICNEAGWDEVMLYAWGDENDALGTWPGLAPEDKTVELNGKTYLVFEVKAQLGSKNEHLIANNNDNGVQINDIFVGVFGSSVYVTINSDGTFTLDSEAAPEPEPEEPQDDSNLPQTCKATVSGSVITFESDKDLVYYVWAWADGFDQLTESGWPGDKLTLVKSDDGVFTYEYDFTNAAALPTQFIISTDGDVKFFDGVAFEDGAEYNYDASAVEPTPEPEPLDPDVELSFTFKTDTEGDYFVWAWSGDLGGEVFTESGSWPGDKMEFVETTEDGKYLYRYTFTKNPGFAPSNIIISTNNGDKIYDGAEFENGKEYEKPE